GGAMQEPEDFSQLLGRGDPGATAIGAPEAKPLTWAALRELAYRTVDALNGMGIGRGDRGAIVLRNSPEMATPFVCLAAGGGDRSVEPRLPGGRVRLLPGRSAAQGAGAGGGRGLAGPEGGCEAVHPGHRAAPGVRPGRGNLPARSAGRAARRGEVARTGRG